MSAIASRKIASFLGVEGYVNVSWWQNPLISSNLYSAHQLGNSLGVLRQYYELGVRYITLTHMCHNAFADSGGYLKPLEPKWGGLSPLGYKLVEEMNRLGVIVDLSHTSDDAVRQGLKHTKVFVSFAALAMGLMACRHLLCGPTHLRVLCTRSHATCRMTSWSWSGRRMARLTP